MVATALAGVVSLANRVYLQPARQRLRQAASRDVLPEPVGRASQIVPSSLIRKSADTGRQPSTSIDRGTWSGSHRALRTNRRNGVHVDRVWSDTGGVQNA
jgi:hypothetical protein